MDKELSLPDRGLFVSHCYYTQIRREKCSSKDDY